MLTTATTLSQAARVNGPNAGLAEFCAQVLTVLAERVRHYRQTWLRLVKPETDVPADIPAAIQDLGVLVKWGHELAPFIGDDHLALPRVIERRRQLQFSPGRPGLLVVPKSLQSEPPES